MAAKRLRGVIVGASSLLGRELAEELDQTALAAWELTLVDAVGRDDVAMEDEGNEELAIRPITADSFAGADVAFFAGDAATTRGYWKAAHDSGASVVDLSGALEGSPHVLLRCAGMRRGAAPGRKPDLATIAVRVGHPAAILLAVAAERLRQLGLRRMAATVMEPASQQGSAGVDEMHQQTVALLSFKPLDKEVFDAQVAFSLRAGLGEAAKVHLGEIGARVEREVAELAGVDSGDAITVQMLQAPVFHGTTASVLVEFAANVKESDVRDALQGEGMQVAAAGEDGVSNESVAGSAEIAVAVRSAGVTAFWLWMAADNLRLVAHSAAVCAAELAALRPGSGVN